MKILSLTLVATMMCYNAIAQDPNTFPMSGNIGIGIANPTEKLVVNGNISLISGGSFNVLSSNGAIWANSKILSQGYSNQDFTELLVPGYGANNASLRLNANGYVGIGTTSPLSKLDLRGILHIVTPAFEGYTAGQGSYIGWNKSGGGGEMNFVNNIGGGNGGFAFDQTTDGVLFSRSMTISGNGNVGIGTITPNSLFHLNGSGITDPLGAVILNLQAAHGSATIGSGGIIKFTNNIEAADVAAIRTYTEGSHDVSLRFQTGYGTGTMADRMVISNQGNVGIGTVTPKEKLSVNGKIRAHEIKVETANWPDYVFAKDYSLPSLAETEKHIKEKGHLPGIPSAKEAEANGIDLGEMNAKLLQKIEELTLHLIDMKKENDMIKRLVLKKYKAVKPIKSN